MKLIKLLNRIGIDIKKYPSRDLRRRQMLFNEFKITDVIDVGANFGQYGKEIRNTGFKGNIYSFEPLSFAFNKLENSSKKDKKWNVNNFALGSVSEKREINIAKNYFSSSFLDQKKELIQQEPTTEYVEKEVVEIKTLDEIFEKIYSKEIKNSQLVLKIKKDHEKIEQDLFINTGLVMEEDIQSGWIYVLKTKSTNTQIVNIKDLYKVGFASNSVDERIKNAKH